MNMNGYPYNVIVSESGLFAIRGEVVVSASISYFMVDPIPFDSHPKIVSSSSRQLLMMSCNLIRG